MPFYLRRNDSVMSVDTIHQVFDNIGLMVQLSDWTVCVFFSNETM